MKIGRKNRRKKMDNVMEIISGTTVKFHTPKGEKVLDIAKALQIDLDDITVEFSRQPALYAFFATLVPWCEYTETMMDLAKHQEYASADEAYRKELITKGEKFTEAVITSLVTRDEDYDKASRKHMDAKFDTGIVKALTKSFEQRAEMLISLGAQQRHEYDQQGMSIRDNAEAITDNQVKDFKQMLRERKNNKEQV
jgi:inorganic triphosphatase YgiF